MNLTKTYCILFFAATLFSFPLDATYAATIKVYFIGGQSNGDGRGAVSGLPTSPVNLQQPQNDVLYYFHTEGSGRPFDSTLTTLRPGTAETGQFGPEIGMGRTLADYYSGDPTIKIAILKYANGGTNLHTQWKAGGNATTTNDGVDYRAFQTTINGGLAALQTAYPGDTLQLSGMAWMQGESDTGEPHVSNYAANLTNFISDFRSTYGATIPFAIGRLPDFRTDKVALAKMRAAQESVAAQSYLNPLVSTDGFGQNGDNVHFNAAGQLLLGQDFANAFIAVPEPGTLAAVVCGAGGLLVAVYRRRPAN